MDTKIVFFDIDGTIYSYEKGIPKDTAKAIELLKANGHIPVICTGRTKCMIYPDFINLGFDNIIAGAGTYCEINGKELYYKKLEDAEARRVIDGFLEYGFFPLAEGKEYIYVGTDTSNLIHTNVQFMDVHYEKIPNSIKTVEEKHIEISKVSGGFQNDSDMKTISEKFKNDYSIINHNNMLLEFVPKGYNKAVGIDRLIKEIGIPKEDTYAFGDSFNDIDMLNYVEYGCLMGNGDQELKNKVEYKTDRFDEGGIYNGLKKFELI